MSRHRAREGHDSANRHAEQRAQMPLVLVWTGYGDPAGAPANAVRFAQRFNGPGGFDRQTPHEFASGEHVVATDTDPPGAFPEHSSDPSVSFVGMDALLGRLTLELFRAEALLRNVCGTLPVRTSGAGQGGCADET